MNIEHKKNMPSPQAFQALERSIDVLISRGEVRDEAKMLLRVLKSEEAWSLPKEDISLSIDTLKKFIQRPYFFREDLDDLMGALNAEKKSAHIDWIRKQEAARIIYKRVRDYAVRGTAIVITALAGLFAIDQGINWYAYQNNPEVVAQRQAEEQQRREANQIKQEKERQIKIKDEENRTLGLAPSQISYYGFRVHYPPADQVVRYVEIGGEKGYFDVSAGNFIYWKEGDNNNTRYIYTYVALSDHTRAKDGKKIIAIDSRSANGFDQWWFLRDQAEEGIDSSVVVFEDVKNKKDYYFAISPAGNSNYQLKFMRKELVQD